MKGFWTNIEQATVDNSDFRRVLYTGKHSQLVLMCLPVGEEIGLETHPTTDQFFRFESGKGKVIIDDTTYEVSSGDITIVPAGSKHNVINTSGSDELRLYTLYSPAHHKDGTVRATKADAEAHPEAFDGVTTE